MSKLEDTATASASAIQLGLSLSDASLLIRVLSLHAVAISECSTGSGHSCGALATCCDCLALSRIEAMRDGLKEGVFAFLSLPANGQWGTA